MTRNSYFLCIGSTIACGRAELLWPQLGLIPGFGTGASRLHAFSSSDLFSRILEHVVFRVEGRLTGKQKHKLPFTACAWSWHAVISLVQAMARPRPKSVGVGRILHPHRGLTKMGRVLRTVSKKCMSK